MAMFDLKMNTDYSHVNSDNFDVFLSPHVGRLTEIFNKYLDGLDFKTKVNLADFGANDGKNIFPFLKIMIELIRRRSASCEIYVTLNDQPTNDFTALVKNVEDFKKEIKDDFLAVHTIPGSAYQRCLPDETIDIGTCSLVLHWLSEYVVLEKALFYVPGMMVSNEERTKIRGLAAEDLKNFIKSRSTEMKKEDPVRSLKSWILPSLMTGLCQTRSNDEAADVCELFFHDLRSRFSDMKWANCKFYEVIFKKL
ncbi:uncharacterized protein [Magallana gigas]|uniref:uncharacterized protein isoform X3 n=1 Tax=Magallana gigas TaxID=29159 RepID=UPI0033404186